MKLQINNSGSWKHVGTFKAEDIEAVAAGVDLLGFLALNQPKFRLFDGDVLATWERHADGQMGWRWA